MKLPDVSEVLTPTTRATAPKQTISSKKIRAYLEKMGWRESVAGEDDFSNAANAISTMFSTGRGLFITGHAGCGKTFLMRIVKTLVRSELPSWYYCKSREDLDCLARPDRLLFGTNVFIDDMGSEEIRKEFGNTIDIVGDFIQKYHASGTGRLFVTTNHPSGELNEIYGMRVLDRILEMCVVLKLNGKSKRERIVFGND